MRLFAIVLLFVAFLLLHDHHPLTSLGVFNIFLLYLLWVKKRKNFL
jgi:hypothetical protein